jgi:hypothetical protein
MIFIIKLRQMHQKLFRVCQNLLWQHYFISYLLTLHSERKTLMVFDFRLVRYFRYDCVKLGLEEIGIKYQDLYYPEID